MQENAPLDSPITAPALKRRNWVQIIFLGLELLIWTSVFLGVLISWIPKVGFDQIGRGLKGLSLALLDIFYFLPSLFMLDCQGWVRRLGSFAAGIAMGTSVNAIAPLFNIDSVWNDRIIFGNLLGMVLIALAVTKLRQNPARWQEDNYYKQLVARLAFFVICLIFRIVWYFFAH